MRKDKDVVISKPPTNSWYSKHCGTGVEHRDRCTDPQSRTEVSLCSGPNPFRGKDSLQQMGKTP
jgi:hypothetical protein